MQILLASLDFANSEHSIIDSFTLGQLFYFEVVRLWSKQVHNSSMIMNLLCAEYIPGKYLLN